MGLTEPNVSPGPAGGGPLPGPSNGRVGNPFPDLRRMGYPWPDVRRRGAALFDSQQPNVRGNRGFSYPTPPFFPGSTPDAGPAGPIRQGPFPPIPIPSGGGVPGNGVEPNAGPAGPIRQGPFPPLPVPSGGVPGNGVGPSAGPVSPDMFPFPGGNGTIPGGPGTGGVPGGGVPGGGTETVPGGGNGTIPTPGSSPLPPGTQMSPLNPAVLYGILSYLASTPALGHGQDMLQQYQSPQIQQALAQLGQQMPSAWLPQIRAQLYGSPYANLF